MFGRDYIFIDEKTAIERVMKILIITQKKYLIGIVNTN